ncbi:MAG: hypothetical protein STSR0006_14860 [Lentimicrobium sp.]
MKKIYLMLFALACSFTGWGQTIIAFNGFDGTTNLPVTTSGGSLYSGSSTSSDRPASASFYVSSQTAYGITNGSAIVTSESITGLSSYTSKYFELRLASWSINSATNGADAADSVTVRISINGAGFSKELLILGNNNAWWHYSTGSGLAETTYDGNNSPLIKQPAGGGGRTTDGYSTLKINLPDNCSEAKIQISLKNNSNNERWTIDDIKLVGTPVGSYITTGTVSSPPFCVDATSTASGTVAYTYSGTFTGTFTAQLSDASGSFASPVDIGSGDSPINITIPANTPSGMGYKIRVINDNPQTTGSESAAFEIINGAKDVTNHSASPGNAQATLSWMNPSGCYDEIMIVGKTGSAVTATPTGDGSAYTANLAFGSGTEFDGGYVVYKGTISPQTVTNLANGTAYYFTFFTRKGTNWSSGVTANVTPVAQPSLVEIYLPQYIQGVNGTNSSRVPFAFRVKLENLIPNATYRYFNQVVISSDVPTTNGAGNVIFVTQTGDFYRSTGPSMNTLGNYGEFTTDANGSYTGWFITEPTSNDKFTPGNEIFMRIMLNNGTGGTSVALRLTTTNSVKVLNFGNTSTNTECTGIYGNSYASDKNFVLLYDNTDGTGRPISGTFIENDGTDNSTSNSYVAFYSNNVNGQSGYWGSIIPNMNSNGIKKLEYRSLADGSLIYSVTDNDGAWNGVQTVNPIGGSTALILPHNNVDGLSILGGGQITVDDNLTINQSLVLNNNASLTLSSNASLITKGDLTNNGTFSVQSDATGTGSFILNGNYSGSGTFEMERYVAGADWNTWDDGWHDISSPVQSQNISAFTTNDNLYDFYGWDESQNLWINYKDANFSVWNGGSSNFIEGRGYLIAYDETQTDKKFIGTPNNSNITISGLSFTSDKGNGWHLLGNPFPSALKWNDGNWELNNIAQTAKIWNSNNKSYEDISSNDIIPATQGFFVQVNSPTSLIIPAASRVHSSTNWYKSSDASSIILAASTTDNSSIQKTYIRTEEGSSEGFEFANDSRFLAGYAPKFYCLVGGEKLSTQSLASVYNGLELNYGFEKLENVNQYRIQLIENPFAAKLYLKDLKTGTIQDLGQNPVYEFAASEGDPVLRFKLSFGSVGIDETTANDVRLYYSNNVLYMLQMDGYKQIEVLNLNGQLMRKMNTDENYVNLPLARGIYLVRITSAHQAYVQKIIVQ